VKESIQHKLDEIKKLAKASKAGHTSTDKRPSVLVNDSLAKAIKTKKEADVFMTELHALIQYAQEKKD
jgi:hypothetical protein